MEKQFNKDNILIGYKIGKYIRIHNHHNSLYHATDKWYITIESLKLRNRILCKKDCSEDAIARHAYLKLNNYLNFDLMKKVESIKDMIKEVNQHT